MSKLLTKGGKLVRKDGKLVRTDNPAACECCGDPPPPDCNCVQRLDDINANADNSDPAKPKVAYRLTWNPPNGCTADGHSFEIEYRKKGGAKIGGTTLPAKIGETIQILGVACPTEIESIAGRVTKAGCPPSDWLDRGILGADLLCPPPPEYTTPGWYAICSAYEGDNGGQPNGIIASSQRLARYYASAPTFPLDLGDRDWAVSLLGGPFASSQETEVWIENNGGRFKPCATVGEPIRPSAENPLP